MKIINYIKINKEELETKFLWIFPVILMYFIFCQLSKPYGGEIDWFKPILALCLFGITLFINIISKKNYDW